MSRELFIIFLSFIFPFIPVIFIWLSRKFNPTPEYIVVNKHPEIGTEVRYNGRSIYVHVLDQNLFDAHIKKISDEIWVDLQKQGYSIKKNN